MRTTDTLLHFVQKSYLCGKTFARDAEIFFVAEEEVDVIVVAESSGDLHVVGHFYVQACTAHQ